MPVAPSCSLRTEQVEIREKEALSQAVPINEGPQDIEWLQVSFLIPNIEVKVPCFRGHCKAKMREPEKQAYYRVWCRVTGQQQ